MRTPQIRAGFRNGVWLYAVSAFLVLTLAACATRVEWTPQPDPGLPFGVEPGFNAWSDGIKPVGEMLSSTPLPLPERLSLPEGRRLLPAWTGLSESSVSAPKSTAKSRSSKPSGTGYTQVGVASWYGDGFHGGPTANGETYNQESLTAAHQTLPFNSVVQVRNLENGKTVNVRINNRGPYVGGRIIDLSVAAARAIGSYDKGLARVEIRRVQ